MEGDKFVFCFDSGFNFKFGRWYYFVVVVSEDGNIVYLNGREMIWRYYNFGNESMRFFCVDILGKEFFIFGYGKMVDFVMLEFFYFYGDIVDFRIYFWLFSVEEVSSFLEEIRDRKSVV